MGTVNQHFPVRVGTVVLVHHLYLVFDLVKSVIEIKTRSVKSMKSRGQQVNPSV